MNMPKLKLLGMASRLDAQLTREFDCRLVSSPAEAQQVMASGQDFALIVTDYSTSGPAGLALQQESRRRWPDSVGVMLVASDEFEIALAALQDGSVHRVVRKPWLTEELAAAIGEARDYHQLRINERRLREQLAGINAELDGKVQDLDEANELLEYWVEFSPAVLYSFSWDDGTLHPSYLSKNFYRLTGFERTAAVIDANFWKDLIHPGDVPRYRAALAALTGSEGHFAVLEYRVRHRDGNYLNVLDSMRAVRDSEGETIEIVGAWMDVSARA